METTRTRYPGAQSFSDDALSRAVFFGRERETAALTDQIIANRLIVVYAKSGLGKTSLLNAGVAEPLRNDGYLPLITRINLINQNPLRSIFDMTRIAAERQDIEYYPGDEHSLWHFFKTAEFWRGDILLTPILIIDQFEELFTLHGDESRANFLAELGYLVRGIRPPIKEGTSSSPENPERESQLTDTPPTLRIVISLREDYLGSLEEAADYLPQIMDHRFRLMPLSAEAAAAAIEGPTKVRDQQLSTKPFTFQTEAVHGILKYLLRRTKTKVNSSSKFIEPFHLQLICQRVETLAAQRQSQTGGLIEISWADLGGEKGLKTTLSNFYMDIIQSVKSRWNRRKVRELCEQYLISPSGRRLSLEESEIIRIFKLNHDTLEQLVNRRLLRTDQRADSWYYELSHDSLIEPILATRRVKAIGLGILGLLWSSLICLIGLVVIIFGVAGPIGYVFFNNELFNSPAEAVALSIISALMLLPMGLFIFLGGRSGLRRSVEMLNRFVPPAS
jgi:hypothetical protein